MKATDATEKAKAVVHNNDEDESTGENKEMNNGEVGAQGGVKEIALEPSRNVTPVAEQETSNQPDQVDVGTMAVDEVVRSGAGGNVCGLEPSDNVNQGHVTTAAGPGTSNKPDAQEDGLAQHAKEVTFAGGKECALESFNKDSRVELNAAVRNADNDKSNAKEDEAITTEDEDEGGETPRQLVSLCVGTNVCSWFRNREAYVNTPAVEIEKLQQEWTIKFGAQSKRIKQG